MRVVYRDSVLTRLLSAAYFAMVALLVAFSITIGAILFTSFGTRLVVRWLTDILNENDVAGIQIGGTRGRLAEKVVLRNVRLLKLNGTVLISVDYAEFSVDPLAILLGKTPVKSLTFDNLVLHDVYFRNGEGIQALVAGDRTSTLLPFVLPQVFDGTIRLNSIDSRVLGKKITFSTSDTIRVRGGFDASAQRSKFNTEILWATRANSRVTARLHGELLPAFWVQGTLEMSDSPQGSMQTPAVKNIKSNVVAGHGEVTVLGASLDDVNIRMSWKESRFWKDIPSTGAIDVHLRYGTGWLNMKIESLDADVSFHGMMRHWALNDFKWRASVRNVADLTPLVPGSVSEWMSNASGSVDGFGTCHLSQPIRECTGTIVGGFASEPFYSVKEAIFTYEYYIDSRQRPFSAQLNLSDVVIGKAHFGNVIAKGNGSKERIEMRLSGGNSENVLRASFDMNMGNPFVVTVNKLRVLFRNKEVQILKPTRWNWDKQDLTIDDLKMAVVVDASALKHDRSEEKKTTLDLSYRDKKLSFQLNAQEEIASRLRAYKPILMTTLKLTGADVSLEGSAHDFCLKAKDLRLDRLLRFGAKIGLTKRVSI